MRAGTVLIVGAVALLGIAMCSQGRAETREVGSINYNWHMLGSDDRIVVSAVNDPKIEGVVCYWSAARIGGVKGAVGLATDPNEASLACRQVGPIKFLHTFGQTENIAKTSQNWTGFKTMQVVRMCDAVSNTLVYTVYSDNLVSGHPQNSISAVPIQPWGGATDVTACRNFLK
jgi:CreA protein